jgi:hypothetical protein
VIFCGPITSILSWGRGGQSDVRKASLKQHFKLDDVGTYYAGTIQDPAIHCEFLVRLRDGV